MTEPANIQNAQPELNVKDPRPIVVGVDASDSSKLALLDDIINEVLGDDRPTGFTQKVVRGHPVGGALWPRRGLPLGW